MGNFYYANPYVAFNFQASVGLLCFVTLFNVIKRHSYMTNAVKINLRANDLGLVEITLANGMVLNVEMSKIKIDKFFATGSVLTCTDHSTRKGF